MFTNFKQIIAILSLVAFFMTCLVSFSFADNDRRDSYKKKSRSERSERYKRSDRDRNDRDDDDDDGDRDDDDGDRDDDDDDDNGTAPTPGPGPAPGNQCTQCHSDPGTTRLPSDHPSIGGVVPPVVEPPVVEPPVVEPPVVEPPVVQPPVVQPPVVQPPVVQPPVVQPPVVVPPALDGRQVYNENCSGCHGQSNAGRNVPSGHLGSKVNLTRAEQDAINAL